MLWFRASCLVALFCVCFSVALVTGHVATHPRPSVSVAISPGAAAQAGENVRVIDIRRADFERTSLDAVLGLGPCDLIVSIGDQVVTSSTDLNFVGKETSNFIDIGVRRRGERVRMIVLLH